MLWWGKKNETRDPCLREGLRYTNHGKWKGHPLQWKSVYGHLTWGKVGRMPPYGRIT